MGVAHFVRAGRISCRYTVSVTDVLLCPTVSLIAYEPDIVSAEDGHERVP